LSSFVTLALYRFDLEAGTLTYVNAGHTHGLLMSAAQGKVVLVAGENLPIGVKPDEVYVEVCVPIGPGDSLLIYSDGITEACNPSDEQFGQERLIGAFEAGRAAALVPFALLDSLQQTLKGFTGGAPALDDQTAIIVEWPSDVVPLTRADSVAEPRSRTMHRRAEAVARNFLTEASRDDIHLSPKEAQRVMYDLRVHQVELEMQAEELHRTQRALEADIVERKRMEEQVRQLAFYDPLTGLANRRLLNDRLCQTLLTSKRSAFYGALMFLDLDNFKPLNDAHGHSVGDLLLLEVATRIKACVREIDTVARFGGDEFVVLLDELALSHEDSMAQAAVVAEKIRLALAAPYVLGLQRDGADALAVEHRCTASIGVTLFVYGEASQDDILVRADAAMYLAKEQGRNRVKFYENRAVAPV
jgi:diguanylate cyclase (GGDEF)-like protein